MELRETTMRLMAEVEQATGCPVVVTPDDSLRTISTVQMAGPDHPGHVIRIHPKAPGGVDYHAVYYCCMIQRFFQNPPEERFIFGYGDKGRYQVRKLLDRTPLGKRIGPAALAGLCEQLVNGLLTHLRSIPLGLRVDNWILVEHPELAEMQKLAIQPQLQENTMLVNDKLRNTVPAEVIAKTAAINAAFAQFWAEKWDQPELILPFKATGQAATGEKLLQMLHEVPDSGRTDRALIDAWGAALSVSGWYVWLPYSSPNLE